LTGIVFAVLREISEEGPMGPGDAAARLGLPRYKVLAAFHVLEELGLVEKVYSKGSYKIYGVTLAGRRLLEAAMRGAAIDSIVERGVLAATEDYVGAPASQQEHVEEGVPG